MSYKVKILPTAREDLKQIEDWYSMQFILETALKGTDNILNHIERLESFPYSGLSRPDEWLNEMGYRMVICEKHVAIFPTPEPRILPSSIDGEMNWRFSVFNALPPRAGREIQTQSHKRHNFRAASGNL